MQRVGLRGKNSSSALRGAAPFVATGARLPGCARSPSCAGNNELANNTTTPLAADQGCLRLRAIMALDNLAYPFIAQQGPRQKIRRSRRTAPSRERARPGHSLMMRAMAETPLEQPDDTVLRAFALAPALLTPAGSGLINRTWHVRGLRGAPLVLQRVNPIFSPRIHEDIAAVNRHLAAKGLVTPRLVPTITGALWLEHGGAVWRVLTEIAGVTRDALESPRQAAAAGTVLARFHRAVADLDHEFAGARLGVHDTPRHLRNLERALEEHAEHRDYAAIRPLATAVLEQGASLPPLPRAAERIVHGDPKISNIIFAPDDRALCLVDLDTLGRMPIALELGDALRSWCNPH